jgi:hypothetical protein
MTPVVILNLISRLRARPRSSLPVTSGEGEGEHDHHKEIVFGVLFFAGVLALGLAIWLVGTD